MARITIDDIKGSLNGVTETYDIVNAIRNSQGFEKYIPLANMDNIAEVGAGILINQTVQNDFVTALVDRIGLVVVRHVSLNNPLKKFKKGMMPFGRTIEEIFVDITNEKKYDAEDSETTVFKREIPNVKTLFHERNRQGRYDQTIQDDSLKTAFVSWGNFENFLSGIINAIYNSAEVDEYKYMIALIDNYYSKGHFTIAPVSKPDSETTSREFVKKVRATAGRMTLPMGTRDFNALAVHTRSTMDDLHLLIDADLEAQVDVDVLAKAFNMDKSTFLGHVTVIDGFASKGLEAVLIDREFYMVYDNLLKMETVRNPKGLYWNYFYHVWQTLSVSRFANAVAFVSGDVDPVTQVIVDPTIASMKAGRSLQLKAYVRANDGENHTVDWKLEASQGSEVADGTVVDEQGKVTLADAQEGQVVVTASVTFEDGEDDEGEPKEKTVSGTSIISVIPNV